ncbi:MAG: NHLP family bacteriocin export ABC transporter peptidase/permease/ATPase subunit [Anaerolinea sp.]|nr:NHLP family bacteriocin export ABC transporter peptidase/permease/ATPase subunit [Anaerolinea sp.]
MPVQIKTPLLLQMEAAECGAAALGIVLRYYGHYAPLEELRLACGVSRDGVNALNLLKAARNYGLEANGIRRGTLEGLRDVPLPAILYWNFNHFVILEGFHRDTAYINDPAVGRRTVSMAEMDGAFTGLVLTFSPTPAFKLRHQPFRLTKALLTRLRGYEAALTFILLITLLMIFPGFVIPAFLRVFVDDILIAGQDWMLPLLIGMAVAVVLRGLLTWLQGSVLIRLETRLATHLAGGFFWHALNLPYLFYTQRSSGDIAARVSANDRITQLMTRELAITAINLLLSVFYLSLMFTYSPILTGIGLVFAALNLLVLRLISRRQAAAQQRLQQEHGKLQGAMAAGLRALETLKVAGTEHNLFARWTGLQSAIVNVEQEVGALTVRLTSLSMFLLAFSAALVLGVGGLLVLQNALTVGMLVAFQSLLYGLNDSIERVIGLVNRVQEAEGDLNRLEDVLNNPRDPALNETGRGQSVNLTGSVEVKNVSFGFSPLNEPTVEGVSLCIEAGQRVALVGSSGSGKSTVARLIAGLYQPSSGHICFDGIERGDLARSALIENVALVDQSTALFSGTVLDNLSLWDKYALPSTVMQAAKDACIHDRIAELPGHYAAHIEENGSNFSGGERQRLEIARALVKNPKLLILDEATSALDLETELRILENIAWRGCTCLIITHRLSTIEDCDHILVLDQGRVVEQGTHRQLVVQGGVYARLLNVSPLTTGDVGAAQVETDDHSYHTIRSREVDFYHYGQLVKACEQIGNRFGVPITVPPRLWTYKHPALELAACSGLAARRVTLTHQRKVESYSAVLALRLDDNQPVALLPGDVVSPTAYKPEAYLFYKPLPPHLAPAQLIGFTWELLQANLGTVLVVGVFSGVLGTLLPLLTAVIFDEALPMRSADQMLIVLVVLILSSASLSLFGVLRGAAALRLKGLFDAFVQTAIWNRLLTLPIAFYRTLEVGDLIERISGISMVKTLLADTSTVMLLSSMFALFNLLVLFSLDVRLALVSITLIALLQALIVVSGLLRLKQQRTIVRMQGAIAGLVLQLLRHVAKLRVGGGESRAYEVWSALFKAQRRAQVTSQRGQLALQVFITVYPLLTSMVIFALVYQERTLTTGMFLAFNLAFSQLFIGSTSFSSALISGLTALPLLERLAPVLEASPEANLQQNIVHDVKGAIRLDHVSFRYQPDLPLILDDLSFSIEPGEFVAIVGASGSGKSTLVRLLLGLETPTQGQIYYDDHALSALHLQTLRRQIAVVMQEGQLTGGTIASTIAGVYDLSHESVWYAAQLADLERDLRGLPMGLETYIAEDHAAFSGGQKQRLLIARALAARPRIVIFDEATSSIDDEAQARIIANLNRLNITCIFITHRPSLVTHADRVLLLKAGRLNSL